MSKPNREALEKNVRLQLHRELYKKSFYDFFQDALKILIPSETWMLNWHHRFLCNLLQEHAFRIRDKKFKDADLLINIFPASTKTKLLVCFNAWCWGCVDPSQTFICISHSEDLAIEIATMCKDLLQSDWYCELFPEVQIRDDKTAISNFKNTLGGSRFSLSMLAGITGIHGDWLFLDDPIEAKNISDLKIETTIRVYRESIFNRLKNPRIGLRLIIGQRVSDNDLSAYIINSNKGKYQHICLPIELTEDVKPKELSKYYQNDLMWEERFPRESFTDLTDSDLVFATQYLQRAMSPKGYLIKPEWFDKVDVTPDDIQYHLFVDPAETSNKKNDPSAILVCGVHNNNIFIKRVIEIWVEFPELLRKIQDVVNTDGNSSTKVYIEPKSSGHAIIQSLRKDTLLNIVELEATKDSKMKRVQAITPKLESKRVKIIKDGSWNDGFLYQCSVFPNGKHDDMVDVLCYAVDKLLTSAGKMRWYM